MRIISMETTEVRNRVKDSIAKVLKIDQESISNDANFIFDLGADSLQSVLLVAAFEEEFDIELDENKALNVQTVSDAVDFIQEYLN